MQAFQGSRILNYKDANYNCMGDELVNTDPKDGEVAFQLDLPANLPVRRIGVDQFVAHAVIVGVFVVQNA